MKIIKALGMKTERWQVYGENFEDGSEDMSY